MQAFHTMDKTLQMTTNETDDRQTKSTQHSNS